MNIFKNQVVRMLFTMGACLTMQLTAVEELNDASDSHVKDAQLSTEYDNLTKEAEFYIKKAICGEVFSYKNLIHARNCYRQALRSAEMIDIHACIETKFVLGIINCLCLNPGSAQENFRSVIQKLESLGSLSEDDKKLLEICKDAERMIDKVLKGEFNIADTKSFFVDDDGSMYDVLERNFGYILNTNIPEINLNETTHREGEPYALFSHLQNQLMLIFDCVCSGNNGKGKDILKAMADEGFSLACMVYVTLFAENDQKYYSLIEQAAENGDLIAQFFLGTYEEYYGDHEHYLLMAAGQGFVIAQYHLGLYYKGKAHKLEAESKAWLEKAAPYVQDAKLLLDGKISERGQSKKSLKMIIYKLIKMITPIS